MGITEKQIKINQYIKDFLKFNKYQSTLECLEAGERTKLITAKKRTPHSNNDVLSYFFIFQTGNKTWR